MIHSHRTGRAPALLCPPLTSCRQGAQPTPQSGLSLQVGRGVAKGREQWGHSQGALVQQRLTRRRWPGGGACVHAGSTQRMGDRRDPKEALGCILSGGTPPSVPKGSGSQGPHRLGVFSGYLPTAPGTRARPHGKQRLDPKLRPPAVRVRNASHSI